MKSQSSINESIDGGCSQKYLPIIKQLLAILRTTEATTLRDNLFVFADSSIKHFDPKALAEIMIVFTR